MSEHAIAIKDSFLQLSKKEQLELMHYFLQVLAFSDDCFVLSDEWKKELDRRDESFKNGNSKTIPLKDVLTQFGA